MKKISAVIMVLVMMVAVLTGCGGTSDVTDEITTALPDVTEEIRELADTSFYTASESFAGGNGTAADPFQISEPGHLVLLHEMLVKEEEETAFDDTYVEGHYVLTADIILNDVADFDTWSETAPEYGWTPIGEGVALNDFAGVFDGNGHKIVGMFADKDGAQTENTGDYFGLFASLEGTVKNLTVEKAFLRVSGSISKAGIIAGYAYKGTIENCKVDGAIEFVTATDVGGICGNDGIISDCSFNGSIKQIGDTYAHAGGISGAGAEIFGCEFDGIINGSGYSGGIVGFGGNVKNSTNKGVVNGEYAGGISANVYAMGTNLEIEDDLIEIENCTNEGTVNGTVLAGGIVGKMGNSESDVAMSVVNCTNNGIVTSDKACAGIMGELSVGHAKYINIENCTNNTDITCANKASGIIGQIMGAILSQTGSVKISGCKNVGKITSLEQYAAGIVAYFLISGSQVDFEMNIENCVNEGVVQSTNYAGGILAYSNIGFNSDVSEELMKISENTRLSFSGCRNNGDITVLTSNSICGGIIGVLGAGGIAADVTSCENYGKVKINYTLSDEQIKDHQGAEWIELHQMVGGIVGRIGDALILSATSDRDEADAKYVNTEKSLIKISQCKNSGEISAPDYSFILNKWGQPLFVNYIGGIVGQSSANKNYAFSVENCTYSGAERGFGDTEYPDFGTKN